MNGRKVSFFFFVTTLFSGGRVERAFLVERDTVSAKHVSYEEDQYRIGSIGSARIDGKSVELSMASSNSPIRILSSKRQIKNGFSKFSREEGKKKITYIISPLTRYNPSGISSTPSSMLKTRSLQSERTIFDFWSKPARIP